MVKFLGKKVLATLIVLSLVMTLTPFAFAENSTTTVTKYSDLGLTGATPYYELNVDDDHGITEEYTPTRDAEGNVTEKALPTASYNLTSFQRTNANVRGFNRGTDQKRTADAYASFDGDTDNMVAKIYGGPIKDATTGAVTTTYDLVSRSVAMGGNNAQDPNGCGNHPLRPAAAKSGTKFIWEIKVKFSDVTSGSYRLFQGCYNSSAYSGGANSGNDVYVSTIGIENGDVFVLPAGKYDYNYSGINSKTKMTDTIVDGALESNKWYTFVKVVEYDSTRGAYDASGGAYCSEAAHYEGKVYVFDDQGDCIGGHDDMRDFARAGDIYSLAFSTLGMAEGDYVLVDDFRVYKVSDPSITCAEADSNDAISITEGAEPLTFTANNFKFVSGDMSKVTLKNGSDENVGSLSLLQDGTIQADLSEVPAGLYTLTFDNVANPVGKNISKTYSITVAEAQFSIDKVEFVGADGVTTVDAINKDTVVKAKVTMTNTGAPRDYLIILALYDGDQLKQIIFKDDMTKIGTDAYMTEAITAESSGLNACIFVWDTWDDLKPLTAATPFATE